MSFKKESKVIGWDDGPFRPEGEEPVPLVGVVMSGSSRVEGVLRTEVEVDGLRVTERLISAVLKSKHREELNLIALAGITFAGFNVADIEKLAEETGIPVLAVTRKEVDLDSFKRGLENLPSSERRWSAARKAGEIYQHRTGDRRIYYQTASMTEKRAERALEVTRKSSLLPEPLRLAGMIARAFVRGES